jgi:hypothetical protein
MTRKLQDRLALAGFKAKNGLGYLSFEKIEHRMGNDLKKRRRTASSVISSTDSSCSEPSDLPVYSNGLTSSSPVAPVFSDGVYDSDLVMGSRKRTRFQAQSVGPASRSASRKSKRKSSMGPPAFEPTRSWKSAHNLAQSSPIKSRLHPDFRTEQGPNLSFVSETSTIPNSPTFGQASDDDDHELPTQSYRTGGSNMRASPPRTPPPTRTRSLRNRKATAGGEEGADLLLYLATSPSPANLSSRARVFPPSTPPSSYSALPSSVMNTPGQQFNFADFVNVTPSPAQGAFGNRTPGMAKTPLAAWEARRKLNFDSLVPPGGSPSVGRGRTGAGLGMELGGELMP